MNTPTDRWAIAAMLLFVGVCAAGAAAQPAAPSIPADQIAELRQAFDQHRAEKTEIRQRLALKKVIRRADELVEAYPSSPDRFRALAIAFEAYRAQFALDDSTRNRAALYEAARQLSAAPPDLAELRLGADVLLLQRRLAAEGADKAQAAAAVRAFVDRYLDTPGEAECLQVAALMGMKLYDAGLLAELRRTMSARHLGDYDMIAFQRAKMPQSQFSASFSGRFKRADGTTLCLPMDRLGKSTVYFVWSKDSEGWAELAAQWEELRLTRPEMFDIYGVNVDQLDDAGESMLREAKLDWPALHLPGGKDSPVFKAYVVREPGGVHVNPAGICDLTPQFGGGKFGVRAARSYMQREPRYLSQLRSLFAGDFLVVESTGKFDVANPPELRLAAGPAPKRSGASVPEPTLAAIQSCFVPAPLRYRLTCEAERANYARAEQLCRRALQQHAEAPDRWVVRNRLIVALMGLWKTTYEPKHLIAAGRVAQAALDEPAPAGAQVVPRYCLAKLALREADADPTAVVDAFVRAGGGDGASGGVLAAASMLAWEACAADRYEQFRGRLLADHTADPMAWAALSSMRDRFQQYHLYTPPYFYGRIGARRRDAALATFHPLPADWTVDAALQTVDGKPFRIPRDTAGHWAVVYFRELPADGKLPFDSRQLRSLAGLAGGHVQTYFALITDDAERIGQLGSEPPAGMNLLVVPGGMANPLVQQLGLLKSDAAPNVAIFRPDGVLVEMQSGFSSHVARGPGPVIDWYEQRALNQALANGDLKEAERLALALAPADADVRRIDVHHLRLRAEVRIALKQWEAALADVNALVARQRKGAAADALRMRAGIFDQLGRPDEARADRRAADALEGKGP